jgi:tRNA-specific 2-thiouridylase
MAFPVIQGLEQYRGRRILVAMSGGVDSSLAAVLLRRAGAEVIGVHMRVRRYDRCAGEVHEWIGTCCTPADAGDARRVAEEFDFPFHAIDFETDFRRAVIDPFIEDYLHARTPNPCVNCNSKLKLGTLLARAKAFGAEGVATGHYARVVRSPGERSRLFRARDRSKDQSYYLFELRRPQLAAFHTPLGDITKDEARRMARELGLHLADKPDSQDICFVADNDYRRFLRDEAGIEQGDLAGAIVDMCGNVVGAHEGIHNYTIGQRRGLGIASDRPRYVVDLRPESRTVVVGDEDDLMADGLIGSGLNWVGHEPTGEAVRVRAQIRHRHEAAPATLLAADPNGFEIRFDAPQRAVTPGQAVVCYDEPTGEQVLAGGWIRSGLSASV